MADPSLTESEEENILYDLLVNTEWPPETDTQLRGNKEHNTSLVAKAVTVPKDPNPQWRRVAWSHDCTLLAYADSTGTVRLFDLMGSELFVIPPVVSFPGDFSCAVAGLIFLEYKTSAQWSAELLVITYGGALKSYLVSVGTNQNFQENHSFSFSAHYSHGITSAIYHPGHRVHAYKEQYYPLVDVNWWSDNVLIMARCSGSVTVSSARTLRNLLGKSCEWFEPSPQVTAAHDGGFLSLECEVKFAQKRARLESSLSGAASDDEEGDDGGDSDSDEESSAKARYFGYIKQGLYYVTEMERFAPPRKRARTVMKNYRLVSLRSTTPEELYQRKIDNEEYGEALSLAQAYNLDSDLVYQRQWRKSTVSIASIQDYLSKIRKRSWVLHECVERVPENVDAAKELLQYGLKGTDLEALIAIGNREDWGRFIMPGDVDLDDLPYEDLSDDVELEMKKESESRKRRELLARVDFSRLTLEQKELCRSRLKLLSYLDRLATYEDILGGPHAAEQKYDAEFFKKFRSQNIVLSARNYARESNVQALDILFTYHGADLLQHRLAVLYNFPETTSPHEYTILLPEACLDDSGELVLIPWDEHRHREMDWCEVEECRVVLEQNLFDDDSFLYAEVPELLRFRSATPSIELLTDWYQSRAQDIDSGSRQVDCALSLVRLGKEREIPGLKLLCDDLVTMETLVYETSCELNLTLKDLQQLSDIDKLRLLMNNSGTERFVKDAFQWMVPFLHRCEGQTEGSAKSLLREYLCQQKIIGDPDQLMAVALESIYSCERDDQLSLCYDILECLPQRGYGPETDMTASLHDQVDKLEKHLSVVEVLEKHGLQKPISYVKNSQNSEEEAHQLMVKLCRHTGRKNPPVSETVWRGLLQDLLDMQQNVYACLKPETCHQVFVESLLCSSRVENVRLAGQLMHCSKVSQDVPVNLSFRGKGYALKVAYDNSVELVLAAAREYFNSSTTLTDPCMGLARACLQLISDNPPAIQEELDLISALCQLEDFYVSILPLQVRLRSDRLSLIDECIAHCSTAYKQSTTLLNLASLLRVAEHGGESVSSSNQMLRPPAQRYVEMESQENPAPRFAWYIVPEGQRHNIKKMYAIIVDQSNLSLAKTEFFYMFDIQGTVEPYTLKTFAGIKETSGRRACGYTVESADGKMNFPLPVLIECNAILNNREEIPTPEAARHHHHHLRLIAAEIPPLDPDVDILLLIGRNLLRAHKKMIDNKHADLAPPCDKDKERWYLHTFGLHHKPGKIRVVFDSSAQFEGVSFNDVLLKGPDLNNTLLGVLLRFRKEPVAITADIEHVFYCFAVREDHRDFLRFLWYEDNNLSKDVVDYRMRVHLFGSSPSPAVAIFGLRIAAREAEGVHGGQKCEDTISVMHDTS
ncbi:hypothetical protein F2P81_023970 [Scophthalmus maximus]|uniref:Neuroblastoma-amplified sequence n=1 Tax=Scophthalmus maximus TaxID=52904 RepID=A0A6A4RVF3_SCOMX|nr:hypothetical protein F2P81_023970 [Scophthalmus maximus]